MQTFGAMFGVFVSDPPDIPGASRADPAMVGYRPPAGAPARHPAGREAGLERRRAGASPGQRRGPCDPKAQGYPGRVGRGFFLTADFARSSVDHCKHKHLFSGHLLHSNPNSARPPRAGDFFLSYAAQPFGRRVSGHDADVAEATPSIHRGHRQGPVHRLVQSEGALPPPSESARCNNRDREFANRSQAPVPRPWCRRNRVGYCPCTRAAS